MRPLSRLHGVLASFFCVWAIASACATDAGPAAPGDGPTHGLLLLVQAAAVVAELEVELQAQRPESCDELGENCQWTPLAPMLVPLQEDGAGWMSGKLTGLERGLYRMQARASSTAGSTFSTAGWIEFERAGGPMPTLLLLLHESGKGEAEASVPHFVSVLVDEHVVGPSETITFTVQAGGGAGRLQLSGSSGSPLPMPGTSCPPEGCARGSFGASPAPFHPASGSVQLTWIAPADSRNALHPLTLHLADEAGSVSQIHFEAEVQIPIGPPFHHVPDRFSRHACVIGPDEEVYCWGANNSRQAGSPDPLDHLISEPTRLPAAFPQGERALEIHPSEPPYGSNWGDATCALLTNGKVACWGDRYRARLGDGVSAGIVTAIPQYVRDETTLPASDLEEVVGLAIGSSTSCALLGGAHAGRVKCWGEGTYGALGNGQTTREPYRKATWVLSREGGPPLDGVTQLVAGTSHFCALRGSVGPVCWGAGTEGQLGNGGTSDSPYPVPVSGLEGLTITKIAAGGFNTCVLLSDKSVRCWGQNRNGQMGNGTSSMSPQATPTAVDIEGVEGIAVGTVAACAWMGDGSGKCWGSNAYCKTKYFSGTCVDALEPATVVADSAETPLTGIVRFILGASNTCALMIDNGIKCWGSANNGFLGPPTVAVRLPIDIVFPWQP